MQLKVGILMGGPSEEREVSLSTGRAVMDACQSIGYDSTIITFDQDYRSCIDNMKEQDIIFNALHGGIGENGKIQAWMDNHQIKYKINIQLFLKFIYHVFIFLLKTLSIHILNFLQNVKNFLLIFCSH